MRRYNKISGHRGGEKAVALKGPWTEEEDLKVIALVRAHGAKKWSQIAAELPGKEISHRIMFLHFVSNSWGVIEMTRFKVRIVLTFLSYFCCIQDALESNAVRGGIIT